MKKLCIFAAVILFAATAFAAMTNSITTYRPGDNWLNRTTYRNPLYLWANEVETILEQWELDSYDDIVFEGATADAYETTLSVTDPTADRAVVIADANGTLMLSTLATNAPDANNAVTGASNALVFEGATADANETSLKSTDPTADNTITLPDDSGAVTYSPGGNTTSDADSLAIPVTHAYVAKTTGADAEALTLANGENGQILTICLVTDGGGDGTLTPSTASGFATIVFADAGDGATLMYVDDTVGWVILGLYGVAAPPATTQ